MINLLPPKEKKNLLDKKIEKLITIIGSITLFFLIFYLFLLLSINMYVETILESELISLEQLQKDHLSSDSYQLQESIDKYNKKFSQARMSYENQTFFTNGIEQITSLKPGGVFFRNISLKKSDAGIFFSISGFSKTRANLISFRDNLEEAEKISDVNFSPLSWVRPNDIDFQLAFELKR